AQFSVAAIGSAPLNYQWTLNGANIPAATNTLLSLGNLQPANEGAYRVLVSNAAGATTSSNANLKVSVPPQITAAPPSLKAIIGTNVLLSVTATGSAPLTYQWKFNGANITGANGPTLSLTNAQPSQEGLYEVVIT